MLVAAGAWNTVLLLGSFRSEAEGVLRLLLGPIEVPWVVGTWTWVDIFVAPHGRLLCHVVLGPFFCDLASSSIPRPGSLGLVYPSSLPSSDLST